MTGLDLLILPAACVLNRVRGVGSSRLPGRTLYYVAPVVGLLTGLLSSWQIGLAWGVGYLVWGVSGWGAFTDLNRGPADLNPGRTERAIEEVVRRLHLDRAAPSFEHACLWVRHLFILPALLAVAWLSGLWWLPLLAPLWAAGVVLAYEAGYRLTDSVSRGWAVGEYGTGALWGLLILPTI